MGQAEGAMNDAARSFFHAKEVAFFSERRAARKADGEARIVAAQAVLGQRDEF
jgi:hypothetical protein